MKKESNLPLLAIRYDDKWSCGFFAKFWSQKYVLSIHIWKKTTWYSGLCLRKDSTETKEVGLHTPLELRNPWNGWVARSVKTGWHPKWRPWGKMKKRLLEPALFVNAASACKNISEVTGLLGLPAIQILIGVSKQTIWSLCCLHPLVSLPSLFLGWMKNAVFVRWIGIIGILTVCHCNWNIPLIPYPCKEGETLGNRVGLSTLALLTFAWVILLCYRIGSLAL